MKKNFPYSIEWTKDRYTIPETISVLVKEGGLSGCNNKESKGYKTLYQALRRGLEKEVNHGKSPRKQEFSRDSIIRAVNSKANLLRRFSKENEPPIDWEARAKDYGQAERKFRKEHSPEEGDQDYTEDGGCQEHVSEGIDRMRQRIIFDFILRYCIDFDQACLEHDLSLEHTFEGLTPTPEGMEAISRLEDIHNYYDAKPEFVALLETIRSLQEKAGKK